MKIEMTTADLRARLGEAINIAAYGEKDIIITRRGKEIACVISYERYKKLRCSHEDE